MSRNLHKHDNSSQKGGNAAIQTVGCVAEATDAVKDRAFVKQLMKYA